MDSERHEAGAAGGGRPCAASARPKRSRGTILVIAGTRPECIKLAPVVRELRHRPELHSRVVSSGQHPAVVRQTLEDFGIRCDVELPPLPPHPNLTTAARLLRRQLRTAIVDAQPAMVIVQGDTLTAYCGARAAHDAGAPVAHIEAGLRTDSVADPFPEEWFRRRIAGHADLHFAPSRSAEQRLLAEGMPAAAVHRVGNTGIDALRALLESSGHAVDHLAARVSNEVLVTLHRRENWDAKAEAVCDALIGLTEARPDLVVVFAVHPNPRIGSRVRRRLEGRRGVRLIAPMNYGDFIAAAARAALIISDSGGIQEEAPHLGTPLLIPRANTERPESIASGFARLVPVDRQAIIAQALDLLASPRRPGLAFDDDAPYGAGDAAVRIVDVLERVLADAAVA